MSDGRTWHQFDILVDDAKTGAHVLIELSASVPPVLAHGSLSGCFFMQKPPGLRLRLAGTGTAAEELAEKIERLGVTISVGVYEPETFLFDGPDALRCAHDAFTADTLAVCAYTAAATSGRTSLFPADFSIALCQQLLGALGLDAWERWDVWMRILTLRGGDWRTVQPTIGGASRLSVPDDIHFAYAGRIEALAARLAGPARNRIFPNGLRRILPFWIVFHWNRMGFDERTQRDLAALTAALYHPRLRCEEAAAAWACSR